jgi:hypothetical protein
MIPEDAVKVKRPPVTEMAEKTKKCERDWKDSEDSED